MYNEQLEQLIDAALADGELTEKEKQILFRKAQALGVDLDEFEMVLDSRLLKLKKAEEEKIKASAPKSNKLGDVKKCPACGAMIQSYQGVCSECGYAFENIEVNANLAKLNEIISKKDDYDARKEIRSFPIPTTKSDLFEFISYFQTKLDDPDFGEDYLSKLNECLLKARQLFSNDVIFNNLITSSENEINLRKKNNKRKKIKNSCLLSIITILIILLLCYFAPELFPVHHSKICAKKIEKLVEKKKLQKAMNIVDNITWGSDWHNVHYKQSKNLRPALKKLSSALIDNKDYENALVLLESIKTYPKFQYEIKQLMFKKIVEQKNYEIAWENFRSYSGSSSKCSGKDVSLIVNSLLKDGDKNGAKKFVKNQTPKFIYLGSTAAEQSSNKFRSKMLKYIDEY